MPGLPDQLAARTMDPLTPYIPLPAMCIMLVAYMALAPKFPDTRSRAYILSSISSFCMTLASLPFVWAYVTGGLPAVWAAGQSGWTRTLATVVVPAFGTYLFMDLTVGMVAYPDQIGMLTGWFHHIVYMGLMVHLATTRQSCVFLAAAFMELPTFDLGISHLFPAVRNDERFLGLMLLTRIMFNIVLFIDALRPSSRRVMDGSWIPSVMLGAALTLHSLWMRDGVAGYLKRRAKAKKAKAAAIATTPTEKQVPVLEGEASGLATPEPGTRTPDESPLVTPYTPSQPSLIIPQNLFPNISIPTMANLPIPNIPTLSGMAAALPQAKANLNQLHFGFKEAKDAVFERWEEQRERLAAAGLRLRRRDTDPTSVVADFDLE